MKSKEKPIAENPIATLVVHGAPNLTTEQVDSLLRWLSRQRQYLSQKKKRAQLSASRFTARLY